jgi:hypothetical protein
LREPERPTPALRSWLAGLALAPLLLVPFHGVLLRGEVLFERDIHSTYWGQAAAFGRCVRSGALPLFDPLGGFGQPLLANPGAQALYPWTWLALALAPERLFDLYALGHVLIAGAGARALALRLSLSPTGALAAGALYMLSGPLLSSVSLWQHLAGAALMPWVLLAGEAALATPGPRAALAWGAAATLQVFSGSLDFVMMTAAVQAALALPHALGATRAALAARLRSAGTAVLLALLLSAVQWVPALELARGTARSELGDEVRTSWSLHPTLFAQTVAPFFLHELPLGGAARLRLFQGREPLLASLYVGATSLPLVALALVGRRRQRALLLLAITAAATLLALGRFGPAYFWVLDLLPGLGVLRYPVKAMVVAGLAWSLLVGLGLDALSRLRWRGVAIAGALLSGVGAIALALAARSAPAQVAPWLEAGGDGVALAALAHAEGRLELAALVAMALAFAFLLGMRHGRPARWLAPAAAALAVADLSLAHARLVPQAPAPLFTGTPGAIERALADGAERLYVLDYRTRPTARAGPPPVLVEPAAALRLSPALRAALVGQDYPLTGGRFGLRGSFDLEVASLESPARRSLNLLVRWVQEDGRRLVPLLRAGGVSHVLSRHDVGLAPLERRAGIATTYAGPVHLWRVPDALPRAYVVSGVRVASGRDAYEILLDPGFDPAREVILPAGTGRRPVDEPAGTARVVAARPDHLEIEARLAVPGHLVVLDAFDPGWRAWVDGRPAPVRRANALFLAVELSPGSHGVVFDYQPESVRAGLATSAAGLLLAGLVYGRGRGLTAAR